MTTNLQKLAVTCPRCGEQVELRIDGVAVRFGDEPRTLTVLHANVSGSATHECDVG